MAIGTESTIVALFPDRSRADQAIDALTAAGYTRDHISVITSDHRTEPGDTPNVGPLAGIGSSMSAGGGAAIGGIAGFMGGILALAIPGIGPVIAAGPLAAGIMGAGVGAAAGGLVGGLQDRGIPEEEAQRYSQAIKCGRVLVGVSAPGDRVDPAVGILEQSGACEVEDAPPARPVDSRKLDLGESPREKQKRRNERVNVFPGFTGSGPMQST